MDDPQPETAGAVDGAPPPEPTATEPAPATPDVTNPAKVIRMGTMINQLLEEVRSASPDDEGLERLAAIHIRTLEELSSVLSPDLFDELMEFNACCDQAAPPTEGEIRIAQAQLVGWLQGLLQGMQASAASQALQARRQLEEMRGLPGGGGAAGGRPRPSPPQGDAPQAEGPAGYL